MTTKSWQRIYRASIRASARRASEARKEAYRLACAAGFDDALCLRREV
jgi:hypothetical protein